MTELLSFEESAHFEGMVARREGEPRTVPTEHQDVADWWLRGWDTHNNELEREAQEGKQL
tara:strand:- start:823 stop:1002 length:180 start_codon:yes stop_codon:yes gene_type:complete